MSSVTKRPIFSAPNETLSQAHISLRPTKIPIFTTSMSSMIQTTTAKPSLATTRSRPAVRPTPLTSWMQHDIPSGHSSGHSHSNHHDLYNKTTISEPKNSGKAQWKLR